jgi:hypothetical protein
MLHRQLQEVKTMKMTRKLTVVSALWLTITSALLASYSHARTIKPTESAEKVRITYTADGNPASLMPIRILESIQIWPAADERNITHYNVYWGDALRNKLGWMLAPKLAHIPARGDGLVLTHEFPANLKMEAGALWVLVCSANKRKEFCGKAGNMEKVADDLMGIFSRLNTIKQELKANDESSCSGFGVMATCGDLVCNGTETAQSCPSDCADYKVASFNYQVLCDRVHRMTSSELIQLDRAVFQMDWEVAVPHKNMQAALEWVREFTQGLNDKNRVIPVPLIGIFVRFSVAEDKTLMAYTGTGGNFVDGSTVAHIEMPIYVPVNLSDKQMQEYIGPYEQAMATLIRDFGARGHWGKNQYGYNPWLFDLQREIGSYAAGNRLARFSKKVGEFDPKGMFANRQAKVIGIKYPQFSYPANW